LAYDPLHGVVLCLAWLCEAAHETWALDPAQMRWRKMEPAAEPDGSKSRSRNLAFDAERNVFLLESSSARSNRPEIWTYRYAAAPPPDLRPAPPAELEAVTEDGGVVRLRWKPGDSRSVKEYRVHRARAGEPWKAEFLPVATTAAPSFEDHGLDGRGACLYRVTAVAADGQESAQSRLARTQPRVPPR